MTADWAAPITDPGQRHTLAAKLSRGRLSFTQAMGVTGKGRHSQAVLKAAAAECLRLQRDLTGPCPICQTEQPGHAASCRAKPPTVGEQVPRA